MDFGYAHYMLTEGTKGGKEGKENPAVMSTYQKQLAEACDIPTRILA
ncbi:cell division cycle 20.1 cofactor of APC complex-like, partial [Trifolium medium]|nr:cell division cycle 20.1 cofactor of APC complex-like [Trifolium medium]